MHPALQALLTETIQWQAYTGQDAYGVPTYAAAVARPGRVEASTREVMDGTGWHRVPLTRLYLDAALPVDLRDTLVLPDGTHSPIQTITSPRDVDGALAHYEVTF